MSQLLPVRPAPTHAESTPMGDRVTGWPWQHHGEFPIRKNACIVCNICFTCSRHYGVDCHCRDVQPRRGKNLPEGSLDSRAKKLQPQDSDYEFTLDWLHLHAHSCYRDRHGAVVGLSDLMQVSLCKAHSSTLYRAKKKHERTTGRHTPPSPADSSGMDEDRTMRSAGGLAAKVREAANVSPPLLPFPLASPDLSSMSPTTSVKRKRSSVPYASMSTPPLAPHLLSRYPVLPSPSTSASFAPPDQPSSPQQLPPLLHKTTTTTTASPLLFACLPVIETVSLKPRDAIDPSLYYIRNLAITDTFTFRDLLNEIDMIGSPPPGKRIVISDCRGDIIYPLDQAIQSAVRRPVASHVDLCIGLCDKPSIDWDKHHL